MMKRLIFFIIAITVCLFSACSDDDSFSTSKSDLLTFSRDTIMMDTVFSTVPTSTYTFWVYNKNNDGLRLNQVRLQRGNQSGFRVNVDGTYLDNTQGSFVNDLEIRKGDSIRVFVELTSGLRDADAPQLVEDNIIFSLESGVEQRVNLRAYSWDAILCSDIVISQDTVISTSRPIVVYGGIKVENGVTLTINAPARFFFHSGAGIDVFGRLLVNPQGDSQNVVFRGDRMDNMFDYLPYDRVSGQWKGIRIHDTSNGNILCNVDIHSSEYGIVCDSSAYDSLTYRLFLENAIIHNCKGPGVKAVNSNVAMLNCQITNVLGDCVGIFGGSALLIYSTIAQFYPFNAERGVALRFTNYHENNDYPLYFFACYNSIITGYADDEIMGDSRNKDIEFGYFFTNSILRTPKDAGNTSSELFRNIIWETPTDNVQGEALFKNIDTENLFYDFHLSENSVARGLAIPLETVGFDRDGVERGINPDAGCYQFR